MEMDGPTRAIVDFVRTSDYASIPSACVHAIVGNLVDTVGCAAAGFSGEGTVITRRLAASTRGDFAASAFGVREPTEALFAILTNAAAVRDLDWHDGGLDAGHPSDTAPALIAVAEATNAGPHELITALFVSYEVVGAMGTAARFDGTGLRTFITSLATVAATGKLLRLTDDELASAIAIAVTPTIPLGIDQLVRRSHWKSMAAAHASMTATLAARLAKGGLTGPPHVFDGKGAVWDKLVGRFDLDHLGIPVNGRSVPERVSHKLFPSFTEGQGPLSLLLELRDEITPDAVESIALTVTEVSWSQGGGERTSENRRWDPQTKDVANHSFPFLVAKVLTQGPITPDSFTPQSVLDPSIRPLMQKVSVIPDAGFTERRRSAHEETAVVEIRLTDGRTIRRESRHPRGHASNPMSDDELTQKFDGSVAKVLPAAAHDELRDRLWNLPNERDLRAITALFRAFTDRPQGERVSRRPSGIR
jgi:2-methylcitrate dehydratase